MKLKPSVKLKGDAAAAVSDIDRQWCQSEAFRAAILLTISWSTLNPARLLLLESETDWRSGHQLNEVQEGF